MRCILLWASHPRTSFQSLGARHHFLAGPGADVLSYRLRLCFSGPLHDYETPSLLQALKSAQDSPFPAPGLEYFPNPKLLRWTDFKQSLLLKVPGDVDQISPLLSLGFCLVHQRFPYLVDSLQHCSFRMPPMHFLEAEKGRKEGEREGECI